MRLRFLVTIQDVTSALVWRGDGVLDVLEWPAVAAESQSCQFFDYFRWPVDKVLVTHNDNALMRSRQAYIAVQVPLHICRPERWH